MAWVFAITGVALLIFGLLVAWVVRKLFWSLSILHIDLIDFLKVAKDKEAFQAEIDRSYNQEEELLRWKVRRLLQDKSKTSRGQEADLLHSAEALLAKSECVWSVDLASGTLHVRVEREGESDLEEIPDSALCIEGLPFEVIDGFWDLSVAYDFCSKER